MAKKVTTINHDHDPFKFEKEEGTITPMHSFLVMGLDEGRRIFHTD